MRGRLIRLAALCLCGGAPLFGCAGQGEGWVKGELWSENCRDGKALGESPNKPEDFNGSTNQRRNGLSFRIQDTSNWMENSNGIVLQMLDLRAIARLFALGEPIPVTYRAPIAPAGKSVQDLIRSRLYLYAMCPNCRQPKVASSQVLEQRKSSSSSTGNVPDCFVHTDKERPPCPTLTAAQKTSLNRLCDSDFNDSVNQAQIKHLLGSTAGGASSCIYFCQLGSAKRGQDPATLDDFLMEYGDNLVGFFSLGILDGRALKLGSCSKVLGDIQGMFSFEVTRSRVAQSFP